MCLRASNVGSLNPWLIAVAWWEGIGNVENSRADVIVKIVNCLPYVIEKTLRYFITVRSKAVNSYMGHILCIEHFNLNVER